MHLVPEVSGFLLWQQLEESDAELRLLSRSGYVMPTVSSMEITVLVAT